MTIRGGDPACDGDAVARLAAMDGAEIPSGPWLVALGGGAIRAALSLHDGATAADPFWPSGVLVELLRERAAQLARARAVHRGRRPRWLSNPSPADRNCSQ